MTFIILGAIATAATLVLLGISIYDLFFTPELPEYEEDMFSTLPWGEIIEGRV